MPVILIAPPIPGVVPFPHPRARVRRELCERHPRILCRESELRYPGGWIWLVIGLVQDLDNALVTIEEYDVPVVTGIETYKAALGVASDTNSETALSIFAFYEALSRKTCGRCGAPGQLHELDVQRFRRLCLFCAGLRNGTPADEDSAWESDGK